MKKYTQNQMSDELIDIVGEPPTWIMRGGAGIITGILILFFFWTWIIKYPEVLSGNAMITTQNQPIRVVAPTSGRLSSLLVRNETFVKKGTILAETENTIRFSNIAEIRHFMNATEGFIKNQTQTVSFPEAAFVWGDMQSDFNVIRQNYLDFKRLQSDRFSQDRLKNRRQQAGELREMLVINERQNALIEQSLQNAHERFYGDEKLFKLGAISKFDYIASKNKHLEQQRERENFKEEIMANHLKLIEIESDIQEIGYAYTESKRLCLDNISRSLNNLENSLRQWQQHYLITAPADGKLTFLKNLAENHYLKASDTLFALMPIDENFIATVDIAVRGMGKARVGQKVIIKLDDYPYQEFGMLEGKVLSMEPSLNIHSYRVIVSLPKGLLSTYNQRFTFKSEMAGTAQIVTKDLRLIEHVFYGFIKLLL